MAIDLSRLGLGTNSWKTNQAEFFAFDKFTLQIESCQQIWGYVNQPFIIFIHHIWGETVLLVIQTSNRMQHFTTFQDKSHAGNIQDDQIIVGLLAKPFKKIPKSPVEKKPASRFTLLIAVFEWTLIVLRFNIIKNLSCLLFYFVVL